MADLVWLTTNNLQLSQQALAILLVKTRQLEIEYGPGAEDEELKKEYAYVIQLFREHGDINNKITKLTMRIYKRELLTEDPSYYGLPVHYDLEHAELASITFTLAALSTSIEDTSMLLREPDKYNPKVENLALQMELDTVTEENDGWKGGISGLEENYREQYLQARKFEIENREVLDYVEQLKLQLQEQDNKMSELEHSNALLMEGNTAAVELVESLETQLAKVREDTYELEIKYKKGQRLSAYRRENGKLTTELHDLHVAAGSSNRATRNPDDSAPQEPRDPPTTQPPLIPTLGSREMRRRTMIQMRRVQEFPLVQAEMQSPEDLGITGEKA
ncbi:uncharacterized protein PAC_18991 [Phialocephala subalpina]|uniref:Uncharacterized protein n=1 Tax=Phialocephala subalpina TaxID=576137 RepID=A0A1L7XVR8_9HELO|nr:uncharacterized protein PAC_18991 [Phialocephala subalpina]